MDKTELIKRIDKTVSQMWASEETTVDALELRKLFHDLKTCLSVSGPIIEEEIIEIIKSKSKGEKFGTIKGIEEAAKEIKDRREETSNKSTFYHEQYKGILKGWQQTVADRDYNIEILQSQITSLSKQLEEAKELIKTVYSASLMEEEEPQDNLEYISNEIKSYLNLNP